MHSQIHKPLPSSPLEAKKDFLANQNADLNANILRPFEASPENITDTDRLKHDYDCQIRKSAPLQKQKRENPEAQNSFEAALFRSSPQSRADCREQEPPNPPHENLAPKAEFSPQLKPQSSHSLLSP